VILDDTAYLAHYGILRKSGRYPWGSGGNQATRNKMFLDIVDGMRKQGQSDAEIAKGFGLTRTEIQAARSLAKNQQKQDDIHMAEKLQAKGMSTSAIGRQMGKNESSVRALLAERTRDKARVLDSTASMLKSEVAKQGMIDVGVGVELHVGVSRNKLDTAIASLKEEGYVTHIVQVPQLGTNQQTLVKVLAPKGTTYRQVKENRDKIGTIATHSEDHGRSYVEILPPVSINAKRVSVRYKDQGGDKADGVIYVRPGVKDISLGENRYAQVRIAVNGTHYIKGMAMYKDDLPPGVDLEFNTSKNSTGNRMDAFKELKDDPDLPFGSVIARQITHTDKNGNRKVTSVMNIVNDQGDWDRWSSSLSSQMLSKQSNALATQQLRMTVERRHQELAEIMSLTNPTLRQKLLNEFADGADAASVHLKAAAIPNQKTHVILPVNTMKDTEVYAPNYKNGERVALVRFPHGGKFEIPELTVNNRNPQARKLLGNAENAIGINHKVAQRLSGADFDGDTVLVIPNNDGRVKSQPALEGLKNFDPVGAYRPHDGMKTIDGGIFNAKTGKVDYGGKKPSSRGKGLEMGRVSNLITDMTIRGATNDELARAVRHSMVVIDAEKHHLDHKQSAIDNGIPQLMEKYQGKKTGGASTIVSRKKQNIDVPERRGNFTVDKRTGEKVFKETGASFVTKEGKLVVKTTKVNALLDAKDARTLSSGTKIEEIYAAHSNQMKALANEARRLAANTKGNPHSSSARKTYAKEVGTLESKLQIALRNAPLERAAQLYGNATVSQKVAANPDMEKSELKKIKAQALKTSRDRFGARKIRIVITPDEWTAIQAGAVSPNKLSEILRNADMDEVKKLAAPKTPLTMTSSKKALAQTLLANGFTQAEVAQRLGVGLTTLKEAIA